MSKTDTELPERLRDADATDFERRLLDAAGREEPSRALSERMAGAIGVAMPVTGSALGDATKAGTPAASEVAAAASTGAWISGALVAAAVASAFVMTRPAEPPSTPRRAPSRLPVVAPASPPMSASAVNDERPIPARETAPKPAPSVGSSDHRSSLPTDVAEQIALIDAARVALASGGAERALAGVRQYEARYPKGTFRPEAAAIKIEALVKQGRTDEARTLAERFLVAHGPSPLADRVARLAGLGRP